MQLLVKTCLICMTVLSMACSKLLVIIPWNYTSSNPTQYFKKLMFQLLAKLGKFRCC